MTRSFILLFLLCFISYAKGQSLNLFSPTDDATQVQSYPIFTWRLSGMLSSDAIEYTFQVAEYNPVIGEQSSITTNLIYSQKIASNTPFQIFYYPVLAPTLIDCKQYVWRVLASYTKYSTQEPVPPPVTYNYTSPIYKFTTINCTISSPTEPEPTSKLYIEPKKQADNFVHLVSDSLYIKYKESYDTTEVTFKIYTSDTVVIDTNIPVSLGLNYLAINLEGLIDESPTIYMFELKTAKGDMLRTKFEKQ